jgi:hypothetical protein
MPSTPPATIAQFKAQFPRDFFYGSGKDKVTNGDVAAAQTAARQMFNGALWPDAASVVYAFNLVTAHYLALNLQAAGGLGDPTPAQGAVSSGEGVIGAKSIDGISVTYVGLDALVQKFKTLAEFMETRYGKQYLSLVKPQLIGGMAVVSGPRDPDVAVPNIPIT